MSVQERQVEQQGTEFDGVGADGFSRAAFLKAGGALLVGMALPATAQAAKVKGEKERSTTAAGYPTVQPAKLASWMAIQADGRVTAFTGKVELGQGNQTSLTQIIAEDLDVAFDSIDLVMGDTARCVDQGVTAGSTTISAGGPQLRQVAADARQALVAMASQSLGLPVDQLTVTDGVVSAKKDASKHVSYGELVQGKVLTQTIPIKVEPMGAFTVHGATPKAPAEYRVVGKSIARVDIPPKVKAEYDYVQDVRVPGMLHGRVVRPPAVEAKLISYGSVPDGVQVVRQENFLAVAAEDEWTAIQAAESISTKWTSWAGLPAMDDLSDYILSSPSAELVVEHTGEVEKGLRGAARTLQASYDTPMETHGALGPSCAVADVKEGSATIYAGTQGPNLVQEAAAKVLGLKAEQVHVVAYPASGCYGRNGADPATIDATIMSKHLGRPVRVQWMRADEHGWDPKGPPTVHHLRGGLDADDRIVAWDHQGWLPNEYDTTIIGSALAGEPVKEPVKGGGWSGNLNYTIPNARLLAHNQGDLAASQNHGYGVISAWLRSPAQFQISFAEESFIDELAAEAKADPVEFRLSQLHDERMIAVLRKVAEMANWQSRPSPSPQAKGSGQIATGRGVALSLRSETYNADIAEVEVDRKTGKVTVKHVYVAQDDGLTINPRAVRLGAEAGVVQAVSRTLLEEVTFSKSAITSLDWISYPILRFNEAPEVHVEIINHPNIPSGGSGEPAICPVPAAIGNAVFDAVGVRMRSLPMRAARVKAALTKA